MPDGQPTSSIGRLTEWAKKHPVLAIGIVGGVALVAYLVVKSRQGAAPSDSGATATGDGTGSLVGAGAPITDGGIVVSPGPGGPGPGGTGPGGAGPGSSGAGSSATGNLVTQLFGPSVSVAPTSDLGPLPSTIWTTEAGARKEAVIAQTWGGESTTRKEAVFASQFPASVPQGPVGMPGGTTPAQARAALAQPRLSLGDLWRQFIKPAAASVKVEYGAVGMPGGTTPAQARAKLVAQNYQFPASTKQLTGDVRLLK